MRIHNLIVIAILVQGCSDAPEREVIHTTEIVRLSLDAEEASRLVELPLACIDIEYPNKLGQVIGGAGDLQPPSTLHPAFYGCFDWHSAVHGHWSLVRLLNTHPSMDHRSQMLEGLKKHLTSANIAKEIAYFEGELNGSYERMYGWAWLLKLAEELKASSDPELKALLTHLTPLTELIADKAGKFLLKLNYPIRVGTHTNTAFAMTMIYDYAVAFENHELRLRIEERARDFYLEDENCPLSWEPSGYDFLSPCFEEADLMRRVLSMDEFRDWLGNFMPDLAETSFKLEPGIVTDRSDGHLVHLDGLNFSRAWCLYGIAETLPEYEHLVQIANEHITYSLPNLVGDDYEGGHWLASFALLALSH